jgi:hypothetical protein
VNYAKQLDLARLPHQRRQQQTHQPQQQQPTTVSRQSWMQSISAAAVRLQRASCSSSSCQMQMMTGLGQQRLLLLPLKVTNN